MTNTDLISLLHRDKEIIQHCVKYFGIKQTSQYLQGYGIKLKIKTKRGLHNGKT